MKNIHFTGLVPDPRSNKEKKKDYRASELASAKPINWEEKSWKSFTERNQHRTGTCVAQTMAKLLEINEKTETKGTVVFSASPIYAKRSNRPSEGMWLQNALDIVKNFGTTTEERIKSQMLKSDKAVEEEAEKWTEEDKEIAEKYGIVAYGFEQKDLDRIASHAEEGPGIAMIFNSTREEWATMYPFVDPTALPKDKNIYHCVTVVDYGLIKGKKYLKVEDSAHFDKKSVRYITDEFLQKRCTGLGILFDRDNDWKPELPKHSFKDILYFGMREDEEVKILQDILKKEDVGFPITTDSTGNYFEITRKAVQKFQEKYRLASWWELAVVRGRWVGPKTRAKLNEILNG